MNGAYARLAAILALVAVAAIPSLATTTFTDGTFSLGSYTQTTFTSNTGPAGVSFTITQSAGSGNPAPSADFHLTWTVDTTWTVFAGLINSGFTYDPSTGAISSLNFSLDRNITFTLGTVVVSNAMATALLEQGGNFYADTITGPAFVQGTWETVAAIGLTAADFSLYNFTTGVLDSSQHPDFSTAGGVISFGTRFGLNHSNALGTGTIDILSDNLSITINPVPEPASLWLVATALAGVALRRKLIRSRH